MLRSVTCVILLAFMATPSFAIPKRHDSLYTRIGGKKAVAAIVDDFVGRCATDSRIAGFFAATAANPQRLKALKKKFEDQLCEITGGGCKYSGKDMKEAHRGMGIRASDYEALMQNMNTSLDKFKVQPKDKKTIVTALGAWRKDIVVTPDRHTASAVMSSKPAAAKPPAAKPQKPAKKKK